MAVLQQRSAKRRAERDRNGDREALSEEHLAGFRRAQALAYASATAVEAELREGMTEREAARRIGDYLADHGVREFFHQPFVWFGDRTAFTNFRTDLQFFPTRRRLEPGMPVILDVAPIVDGHAADIGYACSLGPNALHAQMLADLEPYRALILDGVRARKAQTEIYRDVDRLIEKQGYENRHRRYPRRVLAHRVGVFPQGSLGRFKFGGFGLPALGFLWGRMALARRGLEHSPLWNDARASRHPTEPGLWAVEPHLGFRGVGVKWEELLVVTESDAFWLDDDLPHVRRWAKGAAGGGVRPPLEVQA
jgi:Xaa-Pro aminopeptidase